MGNLLFLESLLVFAFAVLALMLAIGGLKLVPKNGFEKIKRCITVSWWSLVAVLVLLTASFGYLELPLRLNAPNPATLCACILVCAAMLNSFAYLARATFILTKYGFCKQ